MIFLLPKKFSWLLPNVAVRTDSLIDFRKKCFAQICQWLNGCGFVALSWGNLQGYWAPWCGFSFPLLCEVHLWSEHLEVMGGWPLCDSGIYVTHLWWPPTEGLQRPCGSCTVFTYGRWLGCHTPLVTLLRRKCAIHFVLMRKLDAKGGGWIRNTVALALLLVWRSNNLVPTVVTWKHLWSSLGNEQLSSVTMAVLVVVFFSPIPPSIGCAFLTVIWGGMCLRYSRSFPVKRRWERYHTQVFSIQYPPEQVIVWLDATASHITFVEYTAALVCCQAGKDCFFHLTSPVPPPQPWQTRRATPTVCSAKVWSPVQVSYLSLTMHTGSEQATLRAISLIDACIKCEHSHSHHQVVFACVVCACASSGLGLCYRNLEQALENQRVWAQQNAKKGQSDCQPFLWLGAAVWFNPDPKSLVNVRNCLRMFTISYLRSDFNSPDCSCCSLLLIHNAIDLRRTLLARIAIRVLYCILRIAL